LLATQEALRLPVHGGKKLLCHLAVQQPVAVLGEDSMVPNRVVHAQADEPAEQQVVVELLDQLALRAGRVKRLPEKHRQHMLRRYRGTARGRVQLVELRIQRLEHAAPTSNS